jgi:hypothetical protein
MTFGADELRHKRFHVHTIAVRDDLGMNARTCLEDTW